MLRVRSPPDKRLGAAWVQFCERAQGRPGKDSLHERKGLVDVPQVPIGAVRVQAQWEQLERNLGCSNRRSHVHVHVRPGSSVLPRDCENADNASVRP